MSKSKKIEVRTIKIKKPLVVYVKCLRKNIHHTEEIAPEVIVDYTKDGKIVGIEFLSAVHMTAEIRE